MSQKGELSVRTDFDGVWNRPEVGADAFARMYHGFIAGMIGLPVVTWDKILIEAKQHVRSHPYDHGWVIDGQIVTPWYVDQYQENKAYAAEATRMVRESKVLRPRNHVPSEQEIPEFLNQAFQAAHSSIIAPPKPGAKKAMKDIMKITGDFGIVSNSETENVLKGLLQIFKGEEELAYGMRLIGDAKKQKVDNGFTTVTINGKEIAIPATVDLKKVPRQPLVRRRQLIETLVKEDTDVYIEDVAEYLYPPLVIGLQGILLRSKRTRNHEISFVANHRYDGERNGYVAESLDAIVDRVEKLGRKMRRM